MRNYIAGKYVRLKETNILSNFYNLSSIQASNILLVLIIFPVVTRVIGLKEFGAITLANTLSILIGTIVNFGTNETGIRDVATNLNNKRDLTRVVNNIFWIRLYMFLCYVILLLAFRAFYNKYFIYILFTLPIVAAEVLNPLYYYVGTERLKAFNLANLCGNCLSLITIFFFIKSPEHSKWVNCILGGSSVLTYGFLLIRLVAKNSIGIRLPNKSDIKAVFKHNIYLTANSASVQVQQSIIIFGLGSFGNALLLGAYSLCDKVIRSSRTACIMISNALYPTTVQLYNLDKQLWQRQRKKWKLFILAAFLILSAAIFIFARPIVHLLSKEQNQTAVLFLRIMALVPAVAALNLLNVLDQLLKKKTQNIFWIAVLLLILSVLLTGVLSKWTNYYVVAAFTLILETCAWLMYEFAVKKTSHNNG